MSFNIGVLIGIGVGPGDPELITLKGLRRLQKAPIVCCPSGKAGAIGYAEQVVAGYIDRSRQKLIPLAFPMSRDQEKLQAAWQEAGEKVAEYLQQGLDVAFLTEGDPLFFSTFIYMAEAVQERLPAGKVEIVPGVTSISGCTAAAGIPLAVAGESVVILDAPHRINDLVEILTLHPVVVLMKVSGCLEDIVEILKQCNWLECATLVERCGTDRQRVIVGKDLIGCVRPHYLSTLLIRRQERLKSRVGEGSG